MSNMINNIRAWPRENWPQKLKEINDPPKRLCIRGNEPSTDKKFLCIIGSRKHTSYGESVCRDLILGLRNQPIIIVSGLALGLDAIAHKSALEASLETVAFPGSGLNDEVIYPQSNFSLAQEILVSEDGGCLISESEANERPLPYFFPRRNRLMAGISDAILIIEAAEKSGTLITANQALGYNREVLAVPGSIYSPQSRGVNNLIKIGAGVVNTSEDILECLGLKSNSTSGSKDPFGTSKGAKLDPNLSSKEKRLIEIIQTESEPEKIFQIFHKGSGFNIETFNQTIMSLLVKGYIKELGQNVFINF